MRGLPSRLVAVVPSSLLRGGSGRFSPINAAHVSVLLAHSAQIRGNLQSLVEPIREVCHANDQGQFHNLVFTEILPQLLERLLAEG